jgi:hypothetical protein
VQWLKETWSRQWNREPNERELRGLVTDYVKESLLEREARELALDVNDTIVRRRLAQKLEFLIQDTSRALDPPEDELRRAYDADRERYQNPDQISFTQIFFTTADGAREAREQLDTTDPDELGDRSLLERDYRATDLQTVVSVFGERFAQRAFELEAGRWSDPIESAYGFHLVLIRERVVAQPRTFDDVRDRVLEEWHRLQESEARARYFNLLLTKYDVVVDDEIAPLIGPLAESSP